jgi:hypothetical protein
MNVTSIELRDLPGLPGYVGFQITAPSAAEAQAAITRIMDKIERDGGLAEFRNPTRFGDRWMSCGYVKSKD